MGSKPEIYCMTDVEADGRVPGLSNMLSFATAAFDLEKNLVGTFEANLDLLPDAKPEEDTMDFWNSSKENQLAYQTTRINTQSPLAAMTAYAQFLRGLPGQPIFVGYPAVYDFKWIDYYCVRFLDKNPFSFSRAVDVKSYAWAIMGRHFQSCSKRSMPKRWFDDLPHTHIAIDDAIEQGAMFINMMRETRNLPAIKGIPGRP
jgi:hypothetical protein